MTEREAPDRDGSAGLGEESVELVARHILRLKRDPVRLGFLVVSVPDRRGVFAQFLADQSGLLAEIVSNRFLPPEHQLGKEQERRLVSAGWRKPRRRLPNFHRDFHGPDVDEVALCRHAAREVLAVLGDVYGVVPGTRLVFEYGDG